MNLPKWIAAAIAVAIVIAVLVLLPIGDWTTAVLRRVEGLGVWAAVVLGALWIPAAILLVPGVVLTLGTGFLLGVGWGVVVVSLGSTAGAVAAFWMGRTLARRRVRKAIEERPRFRAVDQAVGEEGIKIVFLSRLSPLFPYNFQNYAFGVTEVSFKDFLLGSWVGMLPGTLMYVYLGSGARSLAALTGGEGARTPLEYAFFGLGLVATVAVTWLVTRKARAALEGRIEDEDVEPVEARRGDGGDDGGS